MIFIFNVSEKDHIEKLCPATQIWDILDLLWYKALNVFQRSYLGAFADKGALIYTWMA